jgi:hypothetical protein
MAGEGGGRATSWSCCCLAILVLVAGCCSVPAAGRRFDLADPYDTVQAFAYAIRAAQWRFAYDCLTLQSKSRVNFTQFWFALKFNKEVPYVKVPIRDLVLGAERLRYRVMEDPATRSAVMRVQYRLPDGRLLRPDIYLERESEEAARTEGRLEPAWLIDLERTIRVLAQAGQVASAFR